jgi:hypothetical protein
MRSEYIVSILCSSIRSLVTGALSSSDNFSHLLGRGPSFSGTARKEGSCVECRGISSVGPW